MVRETDRHLEDRWRQHRMTIVFMESGPANMQKANRNCL
jgi:hypothetical protein